ncbi:MAG: hypothetical protein LQ341_006971, partial [Variospora aurantia]
MPPKRAQPPSVSKASASSSANKPMQIFQSTYATLTAPENQSVVRSIGLFGVCVPSFPVPFPSILSPVVQLQWGGEGRGEGEHGTPI